MVGEVVRGRPRRKRIWIGGEVQFQEKIIVEMCAEEEGGLTLPMASLLGREG